MLKYLLPIGIVYIILAIIGVILIIREVKKEDNKEDDTYYNIFPSASYRAYNLCYKCWQR